MYTTPSIEGLITHDYLLYEGIKKTDQIYLILEGDLRYNETPKILIDYSNDLHILIQKKLSVFINNSIFDDNEAMKLQALLQELIKVRKSILKDKKLDKEVN